jgi:hypothetical protein
MHMGTYGNYGKGRPAKTVNADGSPAYGTGSKFHGKSRAEGGRTGLHAKGNRNAMRHGLKAGKLPADALYIEIRTNQLRRNLEDAVIAARGEVSLIDAANIQTAIKWERHGCLAQRWLDKKAKELKPMEQLQFSREVAKASTERDKAIAALRLDVQPKPIELTEYLARLPNGSKSSGANGTGTEAQGAER